ncbi:hypothetical protein FOA52_004834 [Chlamydomonas sp. UWO 241]|nr:hypothetical protein FOA52_004834 [Chlamydomonas sp. UWO 241]
MERLADELRALSKRTSLARCPSMESALGWYSLLEDATAGGAHGDEAEAFHAVAAGRESVWKHWKEHFVDKYAATPSLVPLHEVYARHPVQPDAAGGILEGEGGAPAKAAPGKPPTAGMRGKPSWASPGVARAVGMRKTSVADVRVAPGTGRIFINEKPFDAFLPDVSVRMHVIQPMLVTGTLGRYDVIARVHGGGPSSMAQAVQHGLAKALTLQLGGNSRRDCAPPAVVKLNQMVLHDSRRVERKKPGRKAARTGFTYRRR